MKCLCFNFIWMLLNIRDNLTALSVGKPREGGEGRGVVMKHFCGCGLLLTIRSLCAALGIFNLFRARREVVPGKPPQVRLAVRGRGVVILGSEHRTMLLLVASCHYKASRLLCCIPCITSAKSQSRFSSWGISMSVNWYRICLKIFDYCHQENHRNHRWKLTHIYTRPSPSLHLHT